MRFVYRIDADLELELQNPDQAEELYELLKANQDFIGEHMAWAKRIQTLDDFRHYMQRDFAGMAEERRWSWLIRYKGEAAGRIGLFVTIPEIYECELNYWLGQKFTGKGIVTHAARVITDWAFATLKMRHVLIGFAGQNQKSAAVAERLGFQYEFYHRDGEFFGTGWNDLYFWGAIADEWQITENPIFEHDLDDGLALRLHQVYDASIQSELVKAHLEDFSPYFWWANENYSLESDINYTRLLIKEYGIGKRLRVDIWQDKQLVGSATITLDPEQRDVIVGYWLSKASRGKGIITRTVAALMRYSFEVRKMERFVLQAAVENTASRAVAERLGMVQEAILREEALINGRFVSHVLYSLLASEYFSKEAV